MTWQQHPNESDELECHREAHHRKHLSREAAKSRYNNHEPTQSADLARLCLL
jgi:hypothetical protein